jgi:putative hydrolase of the HAD superfamily
VDGVLLDPTRGGLGTWQDAVGEQFGVDVTLLNGAFFERAWPDIMVGLAPIGPALSTALVDLGWPCTVDEFLGAWFDADFVVNRALAEASTRWVADGARLILVTNQEHRRAAFLKDHLAEFLPPFESFYSAAVGTGKSDPEFFRRVDAALGTSGSAQSVVLVDDTRANIDVASTHGWRTVHFTQQPDWEREIGALLGAAVSGNVG